VYLLVAGGKAATLMDADILANWKGQHKVERCFRLVNQIFLVASLFLKTLGGSLPWSFSSWWGHWWPG